MNRLFRGKRSDNGEWVEGSLVSDSDEFGEILKCFGCESTDDTPDGYYYAQYEVDMSTVGQYTGLTDKNGVKIFEGDILKFRSGIYSVEWDNEHSKFLQRDGQFSRELHIWIEKSEIVGNIHDNPELLKGEENE